jgi:hypothetical protein
VLLGPTYRVGMFEGPVLWVGPRDLDADAEAAGGEVAAWADILVARIVPPQGTPLGFSKSSIARRCPTSWGP